MDLSNENIIHVKKDGLEYIQFRKLLEYKNIVHCFTLKPMDFASNATYKDKEEEVKENLKVLAKEFNFEKSNFKYPIKASLNVKISIQDILL